jgi:predicted enzyme related to lactoylglutathione lyase
LPRVVHFEISADDPARAEKFYKDVFGWSTQNWGGPRDYRVVTTGADDEPGINGGIFKRDGPTNFVNTIEVPSLEEYVERVTAVGGKLAVPKTEIPGVGFLAYCNDTEGNVFGILEPHKG